MATAKQRYESKMRKEAVSTMEMLLRKIKNGTMVVDSLHLQPGVQAGRYAFRIILINRSEVEESEVSENE